MEITRANSARIPEIYCHFQGRVMRIFTPEGFKFC